MSRKELVIILSITFIVVMAWVIFDILHSKPNITIDPKIKDLLAEIDPNYDKEIIAEINKNFSTLDQSPVFKPESIPTPPTTPSPNPSTEPIPSPTDLVATDSAALDNEINNL